MPQGHLFRAIRLARQERERARTAIIRCTGALIQELEELRLALDDEQDALTSYARALEVPDDVGQ